MTHALDAGNGRLGRLVREAQPVAPLLPFVHNTDAFQFVDIVETGVLEPQPCTVFTGEALTYFFYARPAFRPDVNEEATALEHYFPVCLIFKHEAITEIRRVFPFDSGAFQGGLYGAFMHRRMKLGDFALEAETSTPARMVGRFFGTNEAYLFSRDPLDKDIPADHLEARSYAALAGAKGGNAIDSRGSGVEIQTSEPISLQGMLDAVVLPLSFVETQTGRSLRDAGVDLLPYNTMGRTRPSECMGSITDICAAFYARRDLILGAGG